MSEANVEIVRQPLTIGHSSHRRMRERIFLRFPFAARAVMRLVLRFPPRSLFRRALLRQTFRQAFEAANRGDYEATFALASPEFEAVIPAEFVALGFDPVYKGRDGRIRFQRQWEQELGEFENDPEEIVDLGDRILLLGRMHGTGGGSGAGFDSDAAYLFTLSEGRLQREQLFRSRAEALEAAGLSE